MEFKIERGDSERPRGMATFYVPVNFGKGHLYYGRFGGSPKVIANLMPDPEQQRKYLECDSEFKGTRPMLVASEDTFYAFHGDVFQLDVEYEILLDDPNLLLRELRKGAFGLINNEILEYVRRYEEFVKKPQRIRTMGDDEVTDHLDRLTSTIANQGFVRQGTVIRN